MNQLKTYLISDKLKGKKGSSTHIVEPKGSEINMIYFQQNGFTVPILIREVDGLSFKIPDSSFNISDLKKLLGSKRNVKINVNNSFSEKNWSLGEWLRYFDDGSNREEVLYLKDLEFSSTKLQIYIDQPLIVKKLDWVDNVWPRQRRDDNEADEIQPGRPRFSRLCSMIVASAFQDFEIDPGGASRWYHILSGRQTMWLINGCKENWDLYKDWCEKGKKNFLGDLVKHCLKIQLVRRNTIFVPAGWIYAIYTSLDSVVFSGLFLHSFSIQTQLEVYDFQCSNVFDNVKYPSFYLLLVNFIQRFVASIGISKNNDTIGNMLTSQNKEYVHLSKYELEGLVFLNSYLDSKQEEIKREISEYLKSNFMELLNEFKVILKDHVNDDHNQSFTGNSIIFSKSKKQCCDEGDSQMCGRRRRVRCKRCEACSRTECGSCCFCRDMKKFGGQGKMKQTCVNRQCISPMLPIAAICSICSQSDYKIPDGYKVTEYMDINGEKIDETILMECSICFEIVHPFCLVGSEDLTLKTRVTLNKDMPNSWICPKCHDLPATHSKKSHIIKTTKKAEIFSGESDIEDENNVSSKIMDSIEDDLLEDDMPEINFQDFTIPYSAQAQYIPKVVVRMCPLPLPPQFASTLDPCYPRMPMDMWVKVFSYLSQRDLCICSAVCKAWNRWSFNRKLWVSIDFSNKLIKQIHLKALVLRQPSILNLSYTNVSGIQLAWLLPRLPHLHQLNLTLSSWPSICPALCNPQWRPTRYLTSLSLCGIQHLNDAELLRMLSAPSCNQETGHILTWHLTSFCASGTDLSSDCVRCISEYLPLLTDLDIGFCINMDADLFDELVKWDVAKGLKYLNIEQCSHISLDAINNFRNINIHMDVITQTDQFYTII